MHSEQFYFYFWQRIKKKKTTHPLKKIVGRIYNSKHRHSQDYAIASDLERNIIDIDDSLISSVNKLSCADKASNKCDDDDEQGEDSELLQYLYSMLPIVLRNLEEVGQKEYFTKFINLIHSGNFPLENICYLLFLDLVDWHSCDTTIRMRYRPETVKFWQIGYRLFHGKFLRFMSGLRSLGQVLDKSSDKGLFDPLESKGNFVETWMTISSAMLRSGTTKGQP